jgi:hypothetical protein
LQTRPRSGALSAIAGICIVLAAASWDSINAMERPVQLRSGQHFVDFRARPGHLLGHTIVVYGRLNDRDRPVEVHYAGLYPTDGQSGLIIGSVLPVDASVRAVEEDISEAATVVYRRRLTLVQYRRLINAVRRERALETRWHLLFFNCNDFAVRIAKSLGLRAPPTLMLPHAFVIALHGLNQG